ncbi:MAG: DUF4097 family beta strand repeat protein [Clostridia bacterium]|nr:DUF4097 family beta strand repeat protein [Clostridia bacterium]
MHKRKSWLITAGFFVICGGLLFAGALGAEQWDFTKLSSVKYETNVYEPEGDFNQMMIQTDTADISFLRSSDGKCRVECFETEKVKHRVSLENQCLKVEKEDLREWYDHIRFLVFKSPKLNIYLPQAAYDSLMITTATGDVALPAYFTFQTIKIEGNTADIECLAKAEHSLIIESDTGDIKIAANSAKSIRLSADTGDMFLSDGKAADQIKIESDTGRVRMEQVECQELLIESNTGDVFLKNTVASRRMAVETDTGDLSLKACDGGELLITTDTGDVEGTLLSEKIFIARSDTGRIEVPKTITGGRCEITTDTGDIKIDIK